MADICCTVCKKKLDMYRDIPIYHDGCGHYACGHSCSDGSSDTCRACSNPPKKEELKVNPINEQDTEIYIEQQQQQQPPQKIMLKKTKWASGLFRWANDVSSGLRNRNETVETCEDPFWLISNHASIEILLEKGLNINALIDAGVTINQFLKADYNIKELAKFPEVVSTKSNTDVFPGGVLVLFALKTRPHHLRDYKNLLPIDLVYKLTGLTKQHVTENLGLKFSSKEGLQSIGDPCNKWTIGNLRYLGFKTFDSFVMDLGLRRLSHWLKLSPSQVDIDLLSATQGQINKLETSDDEYSPKDARVYGNDNLYRRNSTHGKQKEKKYTVRIHSDGRVEKREMIPEKYKPVEHDQLAPRIRAHASKWN